MSANRGTQAVFSNRSRESPLFPLPSQGSQAINTTIFYVNFDVLNPSVTALC